MGNVIVITGLAEGMGREVAVMLARSGDTIAGFDMNSAGIAALEQELKSHGNPFYLETMNITDRGGIQRFRDTVLDRFGQVDTVVSNVGIGFFGPFEETDLEKAMKCLEINVIGAAAIFQAFLPSMRLKRRGKLVAMSSLVGRIPFPFESIYTASKFALQGMMEAIQYEVKPFGIDVALVEPAQVSTNFAAKIHQLPPEGSPYRDRARRFIERDNALIKTATTPRTAAEKIVRVIRDHRPRLHNQVDFMSTVFLALNRILPKFARDMILVNYMDIRA
ncbi:MAG: SDR family NAD(P)-dependent oxidoreductase [Thermodesulfobacteriota bacterium]